VLFGAMVVTLVFFRRHFVWFLSAMIPFPQTAMFIVAGQGISPFYAAAIVASVMGFAAVGRSVLRNGRAFWPFRGVETVLLALFAIYATFITFFGPTMFEGMRVLSPRGGVGSQLGNLARLEFTISNFAQLAYMLLGVGVVIYVLSLKNLSVRVLEAGIWTGIGVTTVNAVLGRAFPRELFDTIPTIYYQGGGRLRGPFAEPSVLGAFLVAAMAYLTVRAIQKRGVERWVAIAGVAVSLYLFVLSGSGTTLVAGAVIAAVGVVLLIVLWMRNQFRGVDTAVFAVLIGAIVVVAFWAQINGFVGTLVGDKLVSDSIDDRGAADRVGYGVFLQSGGLGVGLGSNRPSSFFVMMLSCAGLVGTALLFALVLTSAIKVLMRRREFAATAWALVGVVTAMSIAKADLPTPMLWMSLAVCMAAVARRPAATAAMHAPLVPRARRATYVR
jgi:hypothetical protein